MAELDLFGDPSPDESDAALDGIAQYSLPAAGSFPIHRLVPAEGGGQQIDLPGSCESGRSFPF